MSTAELKRPGQARARRTLPVLVCVSAILLPACGPALTGAYEGDLPPPLDRLWTAGLSLSKVPPAFSEGGRPEFARRPGKARELPAGPLRLTVEETILLALEKNRAFRVERLSAAARGTYEDELAAEFDPKLTAGADVGRGQSTRTFGPIGATEIETSSGSGEVGVSRRLPSGTELGVEVSAGRSWSDTSSGTNEVQDGRVGVTVGQALMRGGRKRANLAALRQARLDVRASEYELRGLAEALVADVEAAYWDVALAERKIGIYEESLKLAERQLAETGERVRIGRLAETELAASRAEVALGREALITVRGALARSRLRLANLIGASARREGDIVVVEQPSAPDVQLGEAASHVATALERRPELGQARLALERGELEIVKTKDGLLPRLDLFITLGKSGYGDAFSAALRDLDGGSFDFAGGVSLEHVLGRRSAGARHERALLARGEAEEALRNLQELVELDVRTALIDVGERREQAAATAATREAREEVVRAETEKLRVGKSTTFRVALAQRDLVASRISEVEALVNLLKALVNFHRVEGTLLERRGIVTPARGGATARPR